MQFRGARLLPSGSDRLTAAGRLVRPGTIRGHLTRVLLVSIALVLVLLGVVIVDEVDAYRATGRTTDAVSLALSVQDVVQEVQRERGLTNGLLGGDATLRAAMDKQRTATDRALLSLQNALEDNASEASPVRTALNQLGSLTSIRADVNARRADRTAVFQFYSGAIGALNQTRPGLGHAQDDRIWRGLQALYALGDAKEYSAQERGFLNGVFTAGAFGPGEYLQFLKILAAKQSAAAAFQRDATAAQNAAVDAAARSNESSAASDAEAVAIASERGPLTRPVQASTWWSNMTAVIDAQRDVQRSVGADITARASELRSSSATALGVYLGFAVLAVLLLILLVVSSMRAIVRPLGVLASEADEVASRRLPSVISAWQSTTDGEPAAPRPVTTPPGASAEIASVAQAFDRVQHTAYELASQQALLRRNTTESLANLGRRNQNLVRRQLGLISEFEREELDPEALANMFELDHLATRMRRNAESLLVLVGEASPRRWSEPIPLTDVIRAALAEVDDYRRVVLRRVDEVPITGAVVSELSHMLAELIENGLAFSPPDLEVEIYGRRTGPGYMLAVVDHGVGMPADQLAEANARLRGESDFLVAPTRFLGHYVVGRLAKQLGIDIELTVSPVSGVVARMLLPGDLIADSNKPRPEPKPQAFQALAAPDDSPAEPPADPEPTALLRLPSAARTAEPSAPTEPSEPSTPAEPADSEPTTPTVRERPTPEPATTAEPAPAAPRAGAPRHSAVAPPDPFPTLPPGPIKDSLNAAVAQRNKSFDTGTFAALISGGDAPAEPDNQTIWEDPATGSHYTEPAPVAEPQRTRNGLVKRTRKTRDTGATAKPAAPAHPAAPVAERSPEEVRSMLANFRAGHQRGEEPERQRISASTTQEENR
ncbi:nitrate- and nitrite sensing domain-containing protein [Nocardia sp. CDC159]|uniref:histidine kinase n=1 Tax=Nocardia pulmonis TaxID=2951408 RepID=A0A9X2J087_9NOCA|nr:MULTISPECIES: nitrate- and nitrite sensing domain-containing protein [Nocardia]MCM6778912.1 nitrate- and nitrite sensing domain-containing protein [Nocardia pulmonis]MCM6791801.1 nitrate- and nitrite sensing domain-containing protein [Nocardia sp. CDC159]